MASTVLKTERNIFVSMTSPWGPDKLIITKLDGYEAISEPFEFNLEMYAHDTHIDLHELVGKDVTITIKIKGQDRHFNGVVGEVRQGESYSFAHQKTPRGGKSKRPTIYKAKIYPDFWKLKFNSDFHIYQEKSVHSIVKKVLEENHLRHFKDRSFEQGRRPLPYCVRYEESAFNFVSRLLESAGIFYFFEFSAGRNEMVMGDSKSSHPTCKHAARVKIDHVKFTQTPFGIIYTSSFSERFTPKESELNDYNFEHPRRKLKVHKEDHHAKGGRVSKYPGGYKEHGLGEKIVKLRLEAMEQERLLFEGGSTVPYFSAGHKFHLENHPNRRLNQEYVLKRVYHYLSLNDEEDDYSYYNEFEAFPAKVDYRPPLVTPKPKIYGAQTAIVTTKDGEEIWTDKYGRVKVKFHWDKATSFNDQTSCWIRVAQGWAGKQWGMLFTPRKDQEVVVTFLNGDPDHPLITGSVYNGDHTPPYLPKIPTMSTIRTSTSKGGKGFNEIRFNDLKDDEEIFIHAQKNMNIEILNALTQLIEMGGETANIKGGNRTILIDGNIQEKEKSEEKKVEGDEQQEKQDAESDERQAQEHERGSMETPSIIAWQKQKERRDQLIERAKMALVQEDTEQAEEDAEGKEEGEEQQNGDDILVLKRGSRFVYLQSEGEGPSDHSLEINKGNCVISITDGDNLLEIVEGSRKITIDKGNINIELLDGNEEKMIDGNVTHEVTKDVNLTIGGNLTIEVAKAIEITAGEGIVVTAGEAIAVEAGADINMTSGEAFNIEVGEEMSIDVALECSVDIGAQLTLDAGEGIDLAAGADINLVAGAEGSFETGAELNFAVGAELSAEAGADINLAAGAAVSIEAGAAVEVASATFDVESAMTNIVSALVTIE